MIYSLRQITIRNIVMISVMTKFSLLKSVFFILCITHFSSVSSFNSNFNPLKIYDKQYSVYQTTITRFVYQKPSNTGTNTILTFEEVEYYAKASNLTMKSTISGPYLRLEAITNENITVGYLTAFIRPFPYKLFHLDTIQVKNHRQNLGYKRGNWGVGSNGISFVMGTWALIWAKKQGCSMTELLAVNDNDKMHAILVKLYSSFGFTVKRIVSEKDTLDRLTWGAIGTLMEMNIDKFFEEWTPRTRATIDRRLQREERAVNRGDIGVDSEIRIGNS